jgi:transcription initiation factor IIE alpha subunit
MSFEEAFTRHPYDVERIAEETGLAPSEVDRLINELMERKHAKRLVTKRREHNARYRYQLRGKRAGGAA